MLKKLLVVLAALSIGLPALSQTGTGTGSGAALKSRRDGLVRKGRSARKVPPDLMAILVGLVLAAPS